RQAVRPLGAGGGPLQPGEARRPVRPGRLVSERGGRLRPRRLRDRLGRLARVAGPLPPAARTGPPAGGTAPPAGPDPGEGAARRPGRLGGGGGRSLPARRGRRRPAGVAAGGGRAVAGGRAAGDG